MSANDLWMGLKPAAALDLDLLQFIERREDSVGERLVGKRPEPLGRLDLGRIRWQERQVDALWKLQVSTAMPSGPIQNQHDLFGESCSHLVGKSRQGAGEHLDIDRGQDEPTGFPALWMHKSKDVHPLIALGDGGLHRGSRRRPDSSQDGLEANAMLIHRPQFDLGVWVLVLHQGHLLGQFF